MVKKFVSVLCSLTVLIAMFSLPAFAEDILDVCPKCGKRTYETWTDFETSVPELNFPVAAKRRHCTSCDYTYYQWNCLGITGYKEFDNGTGKLFYDYLNDWINKTFGKNSTATKFEAGGGQPGTGGAGRYPSGYTSDGVANYTKDGLLTWRPSWPDNVLYHFRYWYQKENSVLYNATLYDYRGKESSDFDGTRGFPKMSNSVYSDRIFLNFSPHSNSGNSGKTFLFQKLVSEYFIFTAPVSGYYSCTSLCSVYSLFGYSSSSLSSYDISANKRSMYFNISRRHYNAGDSIPFDCNVIPPSSSLCSGSPFVYLSSLELVFYSPVFTVEPDSTYINKVTTITINNNTWNGNIYQDTTNNLTYIYPQYTTINENNQTVTNISNNPIIYNNTTNNYYYITYVTTTPEPTASPEPTTTPDPGTTPTPTPGGDTGDTSGLLDLLRDIKDSIVQGFADLTANIKLAIENLNINIKNYFDTKLPDRSTPETAATPTPVPTASASPTPEPTTTPVHTETPNITPTPVPDPGTPTPTPNSGGNSNISGGSDEGLFGWLWDLLKDLIKSILKKLFGLLSSLLGFLIWCVERVTLLIPFLPGPAVSALGAGVVLIFVIKLIRFIRG